VRGHRFVEQRRFFRRFGVALEDRLAEGALDRRLPGADAFEEVRPKLPAHLPGHEQHGGALGAGNVATQQFTGRVEAEAAGFRLFEDAVRDERPHESAHSRPVRPGLGPNLFAGHRPGRQDVGDAKLGGGVERAGGAHHVG
jgi:hypothetical protein